jgi:hypothetical protein
VLRVTARSWQGPLSVRNNRFLTRNIHRPSWFPKNSLAIFWQMAQKRYQLDNHYLKGINKMSFQRKIMKKIYQHAIQVRSAMLFFNYWHGRPSLWAWGAQNTQQSTTRQNHFPSFALRKRKVERGLEIAHQYYGAQKAKRLPHILRNAWVSESQSSW